MNILIREMGHGVGNCGSADLGPGTVAHNVFRYIYYKVSIMEYDENAEYEYGGY